ncbi:MAG: hypothetical protein KatS3mg050_1156 [Litorilinea sp.]|nr:MAG: hypothetical protein KatS3mg050_1156 [Litorilinea sp.]
MPSLDALLTQENPSGLYRLDWTGDPAALMEAVAARGWRSFFLDGRRAVDKLSFLRLAAEAMAFPGYFGWNWDAFEECLTDLAWVPAAGYLILYEDPVTLAAHAPEVWATAYAILADAVEAWRETPTPMVILLRGGDHLLAHLPAVTMTPGEEQV